MSRQEYIDKYLSKFVSRKLIVFCVASVGLFTGKLEFAGPVRCRGVTKIEAGALLGDTVIFKTEPLPPVQCPSVTFSGKVVGDTWVGILPWNGKDNEVAFKKK